MNKLLKQAFEKAADLPEEKQNRIAEIVLDEINGGEEWGDIDGYARWEELLASPESQAFLEKMADKIRAEHLSGRTQPLRPEDFR